MNSTTHTTAPGIDLDKERELAELAAEHYGYSKDDVPALIEWERYRLRAVTVPDMPGLRSIPCFVAGFRAARRATQPAGLSVDARTTAYHQGYQAGIDLDKLEALARAATPGPWQWDGRTVDPEDGYVHIPECSYITGLISLAGHYEGYQEDCDFIAAANPAAVLHLIALARRTTSTAGYTQVDCGCAPSEACDICQGRPAGTGDADERALTELDNGVFWNMVALAARDGAEQREHRRRLLQEIANTLSQQPKKGTDVPSDYDVAIELAYRWKARANKAEAALAKLAAVSALTDDSILKIAAEQDYGDEDPKCIIRLCRAIEAATLATPSAPQAEQSGKDDAGDAGEVVDVDAERAAFDAYMAEPCVPGSKVPRWAMERNGGARALIWKGWKLRAERDKSPATSAAQAERWEHYFEVPDQMADKALSTRVPGGSAVRDWFLPHDTERGAENVRTVMKCALLAVISEQADDAKPVAEVDEGDDGLFIAFVYGPDGSPLKRGDKLYATPIGQQDEMAANMTELTIENVEFLVWLLSERIKTWEDYIWIVDEAKKTKRPILGTDEDDCRERVSKARAALANIVSIGKTCAPTAVVAGQTEKGEPK